MTSSTEVFWSRVLMLAETSHEMELEQIREGLLGIEEGFAGTFDPADCYEEYLTLQLCRAMSRALQ